ncbi:MAG: DUF3147 family protein [Verrucomicrobiota bacterium]
MPLVLKYLITAGLVVLVSEIARRSDRLGALIASLPLVTLLAMCWLYAEKQSTEKIANHAWYTFWYVLPTLPMFLLLPWMLNKGIPFLVTLAAACVLTFACFGGLALIGKRFGLELLP